MIQGLKDGRPYGTEQQILTAILNYLVSCRLLPVHHRNTGTIRGKNSDGSLRFGKSKNTLNQRGAPDILVTYNGRGVAIEVKTPVGRLSAEQKDWLGRFQAAPSNGIVVVARSVDDVVKAISGIANGESWTVDLMQA